MDNQEYYWEIITKDGEIIRIPPASVADVQKRWDDNKPIHTKRNGSIPANQILKFHPTAKAYSTVPLVEAASQAFKDPQINEDGSMQARWVKQVVPMERWQRYYSNSPGYKFLAEVNGMVALAFRKAIHEIDVNKTPYLTEQEIAQIDNK